MTEDEIQAIKVLMRASLERKLTATEKFLRGIRNGDKLNLVYKLEFNHDSSGDDFIEF